MGLLSLDSLDNVGMSHVVVKHAMKIGVNSGYKQRDNGDAVSDSTYLAHGVCSSSVVAINKMLSYKVSKNRITKLLGGYCPLSKEETALVGYYDALKTVYRYYRTMYLNPNILSHLYHQVTGYNAPANMDTCVSKDKADKRKNKEAILIKVLNEYEKAKSKCRYSPIVLASLLLAEIDRLQIFEEYNRLVSFLVLRLSLCQQGLPVAYLVIEERILDTYDEYEKRLAEIVNDKPYSALPWIEYIFELVSSAYPKNLGNTDKRDVQKNIALSAILSMEDEFTFDDICQRFSSIKPSIIQGMLEQQLKHGLVSYRDTGKQLLWKKVDHDPTHKNGTHELLHRGEKAKLVTQIISNMQGKFCFSDLRNRCPQISEITIRKVLGKERKKGIITCCKQGRSSYWVKNKNQD